MVKSTTLSIEGAGFESHFKHILLIRLLFQRPFCCVLKVFFLHVKHWAQSIANFKSYDDPFFYRAVVALRQPHSASTASLRRVAASNIRWENIICISDFGPKIGYAFGIIFVLHLKPSPLGDLGFDIDKHYCDAQLRHEILFWFLKPSLDNENAHFMQFGKKSYPRPQAVSSKDKIPFEEPH